ncbi:AEC family transporter [Clostridium sp. DL1XJH146]
MINMAVVNQVLVLFLIMFIGVIAKKKNIIDETINKGLTNLLLNITVPLLIINAFNIEYSQELIANMTKVFLYSLLLFTLFSIIGGLFYLKYDVDKRAVLKFATIFSNCGFMGFPLIFSIYGNVGILYTSIFNILFNVFVWTYGMMLFTDKRNLKDAKKLLKNPALIAVLIGVLLLVLPIELPSVLYMTFELVGDTTTPLSMIIIGVMVADVNIKEIINDFSLYYVSLIRLIIVPIITYFILNLLHADVLIRDIIVVLEAMPAGSLGAIFAESTNKEPRYASKVVFVTTLFSVVTIPIVLSIIS